MVNFGKRKKLNLICSENVGGVFKRQNPGCYYTGRIPLMGVFRFVSLFTLFIDK